MPRFVILAHDWPSPHFDLLLQVGDALKSWRLLADPRAAEWVPAEANADHRLAYLDYEGPVSGGRGSVVRIDAGEYEGGVGETFAVAWRGTTAGVAEMRRGAGMEFRRPEGVG